VASNHVYIAAAPDAVWEVLADPRSYAHWVVGSSQTRGVTGRWPATGSRFHHTQGIGPLGLRDTTEVIESRPPERLVLEVRNASSAGGAGRASLDRHGRGTWLTIRESPFAGLAGRFGGPLLEPLITFRNLESLRRLRRLAEQDAS
jgi:uncharacterized protein YndB with AHSA1/START domain